MLQESKYIKIITAVPVPDAEKVRKAMGDAGAGKQGNYSHCSGSYLSTGRFTPLKGANPTLGQIDKPEEVQEEIIEMLCHVDKVEAVISALKQTHPYEEPAIDIIQRLEIM